MDLTLDGLIAALAIVFVGYVVFGVTGFGASPITVPLLALFLPLTFVLPLAARHVPHRPRGGPGSEAPPAQEHHRQSGQQQ